jgi:hypothetical protein
MNFKVGQRVKRIRNPEPSSIGPPVAAEGVVTRTDSLVWVKFDQPYPWFSGGNIRDYGCELGTIAPLTDPQADAFIERIKKLKPYDEPVVKPVTVHQ